MEEIWKDVKGYEGLYRISNYGNVLGLTRGKKLKLNNVQSNGGSVKRLKNTLSKNGKLKNFTIHNLVYTHFVGKINGILDFKDGDYKNCRLDNLIDVEYTYKQRVNKNKRVIDTETKLLFSTIKEFAKHINKTDMGARYILKNNPRYKIIVK